MNKFEQDLLFDFFKLPFTNLLLITKKLNIQKKEDMNFSKEEQIALWWNRIKYGKKLIELKKLIPEIESFLKNRNYVINNIKTNI